MAQPALVNYAVTGQSGLIGSHKTAWVIMGDHHESRHPSRTPPKSQHVALPRPQYDAEPVACLGMTASALGSPPLLAQPYTNHHCASAHVRRACHRPLTAVVGQMNGDCDLCRITLAATTIMSSVTLAMDITSLIAT